MTFHELLEKYKNDTATNEEKQLVEDELEKNEAINDYLAELINDKIYELDESNSTIINTKKIKSTVNKKLIKVIAISVALVFVILFGTKYIVSPLVASNYYNPTTRTLDKHRDDFFYDLRAINEFFYPGYGISDISVKNNGFGSYDISFCHNNQLTGESNESSIQIIRNKKVVSDKYVSDTSNPVNGGDPLWGNQRDSEIFNESVKYENKNSNIKIDYLKQLPATNYVSAYIYLNKDISMKELDNLRSQYQNIEFVWAAIRLPDNNDIPAPVVGFKTTSNGDSTSSSELEFYDEYPALTMGNYIEKEMYKADENFMSIGYEKHFKTLLKYLSDRPYLTESFIRQPISIKDYIDYIDQNGVNCYGLLIYGSSHDITKFYEDQKSLSIQIDNVLPSMYSSKYRH